MDLAGKRAIVTGSTEGIGLAVARKLIESGADVVVTARTEAGVAETVLDLKAGAGRVVGTTCDVGDPQQVIALIDFARGQLGGLEILINNAGVGLFSPVKDMNPADWQRTIDTNLNGVFYCCHYALPLMLESGPGFIINISSLAGKNAFPGGAAYNASKFALTGFSEALMQEVRYDNIRVAYIMPGSVDTGFQGRSPRGATSWRLAPDDVAQVVIETLSKDPRCLTSRIEMRPSRPPRKS